MKYRDWQCNEAVKHCIKLMVMIGQKYYQNYMKYTDKYAFYELIDWFDGEDYSMESLGDNLKIVYDFFKLHRKTIIDVPVSNHIGTTAEAKGIGDLYRPVTIETNHWI